MLPTWVGDACLATPCLRALRAAFPHARIVGVMRPVIRELLHGAWGAGPAWFDDYVLFNKRPLPGVNSRWQLAAALRPQRLDVMILLTNSWWSAVVAKRGGARRIVGYDRDARRWLLSDPLPVPRDGRRLRPISPIDYYLQLVEWLGADAHDRRMQLHVDPDDAQRGHALWEQLGFSQQRPTVVINCGAATLATRLWPLAKVQELAVRAAEQWECQVLLHCGPAERESMNQIAAAAAHPRVASMGAAAQLPLGLSKAVMQRAAVVVSTDSGPRHMAVALDRPVVTLYGPTDPKWTTTYNRTELPVAIPLACRPCYRSPCPLKHHRCMHDISVDQVLAAIAQHHPLGRVPTPQLV